ncbi:glycosyltransferase family 2 protein [Aurantiacibacter xanthus]|uniref:glycosyltransferase family 2 protein n=1 Tax=Aurantiacibacter xanthus TaxID=1784712 RepID=UPI001C71A352|nr:glycosyltransferase family 2 protein [Aurantiacibacter xanthus]
MVGKRLRARYRLEAAFAALPFARQRWMTDAGREDLRTIARCADSKKFLAIGVHLHIAHGTSKQAIRSAVSSVQRQSVRARTVLVTAEDPTDAEGLQLDDPMTLLAGAYASQSLGLRAVLEAARDLQIPYMLPLAGRAQLPQHALAAYVAHLLQWDGERNKPALLFGDELMMSGQGRICEAWLKPEWDARMAWSQDYVSGACLVSVDAALAAVADNGGVTPPSIYGWALSMLVRAPSLAVTHVARITCCRPVDAWQDEGPGRLAQVEQFAPIATLARPGPFGTVRLQYPLPAPAPKVSILVATRDRVDLLRTCVQGLLEETAYPNFELIVADNDSREPETLRYMDEIAEDPRVRVVHWPHPFNYSAINNFAAGHASGEYLCLLNNDIEVLEPQWLEEMVREAVQPGVGAVGARLLYPDRTIQHAGVALGIGNAAGHAHRGLPVDDAGYFAQTHVVRGASAVTAACLVVAKRHFDAVGGLDEVALAVAYNDVDLCLKLRQRGLANIYTPLATLIHHESKSRGLDFAPEHLERYMRELAVFQQRWGTTEAVDPWHHPQLNRQSEVFN